MSFIPLTPGGTSAMAFSTTAAGPLLRSDHRWAQSIRQKSQRAVDLPRVAPVERDLHAVGGVRLGVGADLHPGEGRHGLVERAGNLPFARARVEGPAIDRGRLE